MLSVEIYFVAVMKPPICLVCQIIHMQVKRKWQHQQRKMPKEKKKNIKRYLDRNFGYREMVEVNFVFFFAQGMTTIEMMMLMSMIIKKKKMLCVRTYLAAHF